MLPDPPTFEDKYAERQYQKERLALGFRIFAKLGFDEGVAGHITLRVRAPRQFYRSPVCHLFLFEVERIIQNAGCF